MSHLRFRQSIISRLSARCFSTTPPKPQPSAMPTSAASTLTAHLPAAALEQIEQMSQALSSGNRSILARAITLLESSLASHRVQANTLLSLLPPSKPTTLRVGISGSPGVGKSTLIEELGLCMLHSAPYTSSSLRALQRLAVLTIDPTSLVTGGSILADRTRMPVLSQQQNAFIRQTPSKLTLGGTHVATADCIRLCEANGYDGVIIETVGVGQSEVAVRNMVDMFILLVQPGSGDDLQGMKKGIMELADLIVVTKADGNTLTLAQHTAADYARALQLMMAVRNYEGNNNDQDDNENDNQISMPQQSSTASAPSSSSSSLRQWKPRVVLCSSIAHDSPFSVKSLYKRILEFDEWSLHTSHKLTQRQKQSRQAFTHNLAAELTDAMRLSKDAQLNTQMKHIESAVSDGRISGRTGAYQLAEWMMTQWRVQT